jgi:hypothetical protein
MVALPPLDVTFLAAVPVEEADPIKPEPLPTILAETERAYRRQLRTRNIAAKESHGVRLGGRLSEDGTPLLAVRTRHPSPVTRHPSPVTILSFNPDNGGKIWEWTVGGRSLVPPHAKDYSREFGVDLFWLPGAGGWSAGEEKAAYELVSHDVKDGVATVTFRRRLVAPVLAGLELTKTYRVSPDAAQVEVSVKVVNRGAQPMAISYWSHHAPSLGAEELAKAGLHDYEHVEFLYPTDGGVAAIVPPGGDLLFAPPDAPLTPGQEDFEKSARKGVLRGNWVMEFCPMTQEAFRCVFELEQLTQVYTCRGAQPSTLEWMYRPTTLPPGGAWQTTYRLEYYRGQDRDALLKALNLGKALPRGNGTLVPDYKPDGTLVPDYKPDADTILLEHFDGTLNTENGAWLSSQPAYAEGVKGLAAEFNQPTLSRHAVRLSGRTLAQGTVEAWVRLTARQRGAATIVSVGTAGNTTVAFGVNGKNQLVGSVIGQVQVSATGPELPMDTWVHVALTWQPGPQGGVRLFVNGKLAAETRDERATPHSAEWTHVYVGGAPYWDGGEVWYTDFNFVGRIDEVRLSGVVRRW